MTVLRTVGADPTAGGNGTKTLWAANRLAFEALRFFPVMPVRGGMGVVGWRAKKPDQWQENCNVWGGHSGPGLSPPWLLSPFLAFEIFGATKLWRAIGCARLGLTRSWNHIESAAGKPKVGSTISPQLWPYGLQRQTCRDNDGK